MSKPLAMLAIGLLLGGGVGFVAALSTGASLDGHGHDAGGHASVEHDHAAHGHAVHDHEGLTDAGDFPPTLRAVLHKDPGSGWNLHVTTEHFRFAPENVSTLHVPGEGHAHVYVDGDKIARLYGPWMHIGALPEGAEALTVTLNANDHTVLATNGAPLSVTIPIPSKDP